MRIERIRKESFGGRTRLAADVTWETRASPPGTLAFETSNTFSADLEPSADAFLVALLPSAQWEGEERILIEGRICSRLRDGLSAAMAVIEMWCPHCTPLNIEPTDGLAPTVRRREPWAASFLSGGVDAMALLRGNRLDYAPDHPGYIRDGLLLFGMNTYDFDAAGRPRPERLAAFDAHTKRMTQLAESAGATLIPMHTNIRRFYNGNESWATVGFGGGTLSVAHCLAGRIDRVEIASAGLRMQHGLEGSHPSLDHYFSTEAVTVHHAQTGLSRFEKTRMVADWPEALSVLRPCAYKTIPSNGHINCGNCEKCIRTMLTLVALGKLHQAAAFPFGNLTSALVEPLLIERDNDVMYYEQILDPLIGAGRSDLAAPVRRKISEYRRRQRRARVLNLAKRAFRSGY